MDTRRNRPAVQSATDRIESWDSCWDGSSRFARARLEVSATRQFGGASWNRTSDLSIIREIGRIPLRPAGGPTRSLFAVHQRFPNVSVRRTGTQWDGLGDGPDLSGTELGQSGRLILQRMLRFVLRLVTKSWACPEELSGAPVRLDASDFSRRDGVQSCARIGKGRPKPSETRKRTVAPSSGCQGRPQAARRAWT